MWMTVVTTTGLIWVGLLALMAMAGAVSGTVKFFAKLLAGFFSAYDEVRKGQVDFSAPWNSFRWRDSGFQDSEKTLFPNTMAGWIFYSFGLGVLSALAVAVWVFLGRPPFYF